MHTHTHQTHTHTSDTHTHTHTHIHTDVRHRYKNLKTHSLEEHSEPMSCYSNSLPAKTSQPARFIKKWRDKFKSTRSTPIQVLLNVHAAAYTVLSPFLPSANKHKPFLSGLPMFAINYWK